MLTLFARGGGGKGWGLVPTADSFVCRGSIRDLEKVRFSGEFLKFKVFGLKKFFFKNFVFKGYWFICWHIL